MIRSIVLLVSTIVAPLLTEQAADGVDSGNKNATWPSSCETDPRWPDRSPPQ